MCENHQLFMYFAQFVFFRMNIYCLSISHVYSQLAWRIFLDAVKILMYLLLEYLKSAWRFLTSDFTVAENMWFFGWQHVFHDQNVLHTHYIFRWILNIGALLQVSCTDFFADNYFLYVLFKSSVYWNERHTIAVGQSQLIPW